MMWARVIEFMLGCWLAVSPFVFRHDDDSTLWAADYSAAIAVICLAMLSYWPRTRLAHFGTVVVAIAMIAFVRFAGGWQPGPGFQNHLVVGLLLLMFAIVPTQANRPAPRWYTNQKGAC